MKPLCLPLGLAVAMSAALSLSALADPVLTPVGAISTNTDKPVKAPAEGTAGQTNEAKPNAASPTGAAKNMAPVRGNPKENEKATAPKADAAPSASGLTSPGAASGSSLGSGSNSTLGGSSGTEKK